MKKALDHLRLKDKKLGKIITQVGPCKIARRGDKNASRPKSPFLSLAKSICYQQLHGKAAETIWQRTLALPKAPNKFSPEWVKKTSIEKLRTAGLSNAKAIAMKDLAEKTLDKTIPTWKGLEKLSDGEIIERLTQVKGIGQWTVEMLLIFSMGRPDVLPVNDYGVRNGFSKVYTKGVFPTPKELAKFGERWQPYRSFAAWYLWRATEL
jgi:3-methyladenine DNA glycosylase/8-oxoguanine DNA glycosylase